MTTLACKSERQKICYLTKVIKNSGSIKVPVWVANNTSNKQENI